MFLLSLIIIVQFTTFYTIGKHTIHVVCLSNFEILAYDVDRIGLYSPYKKFTGDEQKHIRNMLQDRYRSILFPENEEEFNRKHRLNEHSYGISYEVGYIRPFTAKIYEHNGTLYYGEAWDT